MDRKERRKEARAEWKLEKKTNRDMSWLDFWKIFNKKVR